MDELKTLIQQFMPFAKKQMGFTRPPKLFLRQDTENASNPLGKTGFYDPQGESITIYVTERHPKDILRSLSHELMHHTQNCNGEFKNTEGMGEQGYAQNNEHMRNMEIQAYQASIVFRDWEDSLKETIYYEHLQKGATKTMSTKEWKNGELTTLLSEAWGFNFDPQLLNEVAAVSEQADSEEDDEELEEGGLAHRRGMKDPRNRRPEASPLSEEDEIEEAGREAPDLEAETRAESDSPPPRREEGIKETDFIKKKAVSEAQICEIAKRAIKRLKETKQNG